LTETAQPPAARHDSPKPEANMKIHSPLFLLAALGVLSAAGSAAAQVDTSAWKCSACPFPKGSSGTVEAGLGAVSDASAKFGDYTGLQRDGAHLVLGGSLVYRGDGGYFADVSASDLGLESRSLSARTGREGLYTLRLGYAEIPRHYSDDAATPFLGNGGGVLTLPAGFPADNTAAMPLAATLRPVELGSKRSRFDVGASFIGGANWTYRVGLRHDVRDGTQRGAGSFFADTAQLAVPVDHVTDQFEVAAAYASRRLQASLAYQYSQFRNGQDSLTWANPFNPVIAGSSTGQLALAPDNEFHQIVGTAGYELTPQIRASADFAVGRMTQDVAFLDPTTNPNLPVTLADLPATSLRGKVETFAGSVRLTATPIERLRVNASYARDRRDNRTPIGSYPALATDMFLGATPRSNEPYDSTRDLFKLNGDYRGPGGLKTSLGIDHDRRARSYQEVVNTRETTLWGRVSAQPLENVSLAAKLAHADRSGSTYGVSTWIDSPQNPLLRKFNLADRLRDSAGLRADVTVNEKVSVGVTLDLANDDYDKSLIGLTEARSVNLGADLSVAFSEQTRLHLFAQGERIRSEQAGSQAFASPDWSARVKDKVDLIGAGIKHTVIADKLDVGADLTFSRSNSDITVDTGVSANAAFPTATTSLDSLKLYATYKLKDNLSLTGSYWYEDYSAKDWRLDGVLPGTVADLLAFGEQPPRYRVHLLRVAMRYRF
jgi:MtrB/PioB family decaheme-associated outer membrane protein